MMLDVNDKDRILDISAFQYDIVCNGIELSSGAIRNHKPEIMKKAFEIAGYGEEVLLENSAACTVLPIWRSASWWHCARG